jgi:ribosome-binding protein aMBF1 (putative translation factor)
MQMYTMPSATQTAAVQPRPAGSLRPASASVSSYRPVSSAAAAKFFPSATAKAFSPAAPPPKPMLMQRPQTRIVEDPTLPKDICSRFGRRMRQLRQERGLTQVDVAVHFGIDRTFLSDVERGRKGVCLPTLEVMALGFGISLSELMRGL